MVERVVVIGAGVVGLCAAHELQRRGLHVTLLEARQPGAAASQRNSGQIGPSRCAPLPAPGVVADSIRWMLRSDSPLYIKPRADPHFAAWLFTFWRQCTPRAYARGQAALAALNARTLALFDEYAARGMRWEYHRDCGVLQAYLTDATFQAEWRLLQPARDYGYEIVAVEGAAVREHEPELHPDVVAGIWVPGDRHLRPDDFCAALAARLAADGVAVRVGEPVTTLDRRGPRVSAVATPGGRYPADAVVVAAGAWTPRVTELAGVRVPIEAGKGYSLDFAPAPVPVRRPMVLGEAHMAVTPLDGAVRLGGTMELSGLNERIRRERIAALSHGARQYFRRWPEGVDYTGGWVGMRPLSPDGLPIIGRAPRTDNLYVASGHGMYGVTLAPATGEALAEFIAGGREPDVLSPFSPARFA